MAEFKMPGVYVEEIDAFPSSIAGVPTAVPAFIGTTAQADDDGQSRSMKPMRIVSLAEFRRIFGAAPPLQTGYRLYHGMAHYFLNGGGPCFVVSVGGHDSAISAADFVAGIETLETEQEPTLLVIPECVSLDEPSDCFAVQQQMLAHCGGVMKNRFAILDIHNGFKPRKPGDDCVAAFRAGLTTEFGSFGAAYHPWLESSVVSNELTLLPPSAAIAGIYAQVDNARGVWKAPANVGVAGVVRPALPIGDQEQADLNVTPQGRSVNAIRAFAGRGALVWGARTLDGNSLDWRYINVRRTTLFIEASCRLALKALVFEPNAAGTWITVQSMIENFLVNLWKQGGLMGATPKDAFHVSVGLGSTMTAQDVLDGMLRVTLLIALIRPAEFIAITLQQQMSKS